MMRALWQVVLQHIGSYAVETLNIGKLFLASTIGIRDSWLYFNDSLQHIASYAVETLNIGSSVDWQYRANAI